MNDFSKIDSQNYELIIGNIRIKLLQNFNYPDTQWNCCTGKMYSVFRDSLTLIILEMNGTSVRKKGTP